MKLLIRTSDRAIHDASDVGAWRAGQTPGDGGYPVTLEVVDVPGKAETFAWPNGMPSRCRLAANGLSIEAIPGVPAYADPRETLKTKLRATAAGGLPEVKAALQALLDTLD